MSYVVKEIFYTLQGEGAQSGRAAVFCRFAGCNLWSGREEDRPGAECSFCDTDFVGTDGEGGGEFDSAAALADAVKMCWPAGDRRRFVVCTGGEPLLQLDVAVVAEFHARGFEIAVETNGTLPLIQGLDWVCVSPKAGADLVVRSADELKLVYPQLGLSPETFAGYDAPHRFLQPLDGPQRQRHTRMAVAYCLANPEWRLSVQAHKYWGIP